MAEQVLTNGVEAESEFSFSEQSLVPLSVVLQGVRAHIDVILAEGTASLPSTASGAVPDRETPPLKPKRGGWRETAYISHALRKDTKRKAGLLQREGYRFTVFASVRGMAGEPDAKSKRHVCLEFSRLGQELKRHNHPYVGVAFYEKINGFLHGHMPLHVAAEQIDVVKSWADRFDEKRSRTDEIVEGVDRHARPFVWSDLDYAGKQRRYCGKCEKYFKFYQKGEPFKGSRVAFTTEAKAIIRQIEEREAEALEHVRQSRFIAEPKAIPTTPATPVWLFDDAGQGHLFDKPSAPAPAPPRAVPRHREKLPPAPMLRLFSVVGNVDVLAEIERLGATDAERAARLGISRPQVTNIRNGQYGASGEIVRRVLEVARA